MQSITEIARSVQQTRAFAMKCGQESLRGSVYALIGNLGSGKTEFVRGFVNALIPEAVVTSPSFSIVNTYESAVWTIHHFDFYRLTTISELIEIGFYEYMDAETICLIEWADLFTEVLPASTITISFLEHEDDGRIIQLSTPNVPL
ncbi:MAG: tRNA (adenosine(37)-N6)-threonylcarbamoyltransferase complex ATPase subunit type 1 TsaE [Chitinivibrionales bacterium]|nr:tRNA (adenosine(37)-N6)-threonylcarbamoyltransferase complex ATPase subunit type 1 TsaE [Chitinivibrionales bacterium]